MSVELLSPAKDIETAIAAIDCGADAVYIGGPDFGARSKAGNSLDDIQKLVNYAHKFYVKVYVTVNTILKDSELENVKTLISKLYDIGVDALIVQDMGIIKLSVDGEIPSIPLHISTQCDNRTLEKVRFFDKLGLPRVVLARELSLDEIQNIKNNTNIELECFVHGALCVSYSGQCYLSEYIGGRSANRGECAQPCRKLYSLVDDKGKVLVKDKHLLSTKDFNAFKHISKMVDIGVKSFKIEGRLKDIDYVKSVTLYYRRELDKITSKTSSGKVITDFIPDINKTFNRGYTDYFLEKRKDCFNFDAPKGQYIGKVIKVSNKYFETDTKENLSAQDGLLIGSEGCLINRVENNKVFPNKMPSVKVGDVVFRTKDFKYDKSISSSKIQRKIEVDIIVNNGKIEFIDEDNNRILLDLPNGDIPKNQEKINEIFKTQIAKMGDSDFTLKNISIDNVTFLPVSVINDLRRNALALLMEERIKNYQRQSQKPIKYIDYYKNEDDYRANVYNDYAKEFYKNCNCDIKESAFEKTHRKNVELMRTKHCIKYALNKCKSKDKLFLVDDRNKKYELKFDCKNCEMVILEP